MNDARSAPHETFGQAFKRIRTDKGLSIKRAAEVLGLHKGTVAGWEAGKHPQPPMHADLLKFDPRLRDALFDPENQRGPGRKKARKSRPQKAPPPTRTPEQHREAFDSGKEKSLLSKAIRLLGLVRALEHDDDVIRLLREAEKAGLSIADLLVLLGARSE